MAASSSDLLEYGKSAFPSEQNSIFLMCCLHNMYFCILIERHNCKFTVTHCKAGEFVMVDDSTISLASMLTATQTTASRLQMKWRWRFHPAMSHYSQARAVTCPGALGIVRLVLGCCLKKPRDKGQYQFWGPKESNKIIPVKCLYFKLNQFHCSTPGLCAKRNHRSECISNQRMQCHNCLRLYCS